MAELHYPKDMKTITTKHIRLEALPGDLVDDALNACIARAGKDKTTVKLDFNGVDIVAYPGDSLKDVGSRYDTDRSKAQTEAAAKRQELVVDRLLTAALVVINQKDWTHAQLREALTQ